MTPNARMAARALLTLLHRGNPPTAIEVVDYVYEKDVPASGKWIDFYEKWTAYVPRIVEVLKLV
jgi:hypothetical protein